MNLFRICYCLVAAVLSIFVLSSCQSSESRQAPASLNGQTLSVQYCGSCHAYPAPSLLDKATWQRYILPRMGHRLGIYANDSVRPTLIEAGPGGARVEQAGAYPTEPQITEAEWTAIQEYYLQEAPTTLDTTTHAPLTIGLPHFQVQVPSFRLSPPSTTMVKIQPGGFWLGDANTKRLYQFDTQQQLLNAANVREGAISLDNNKESLRVTVMGSFSPTDAPTGLLLSLPLQPNQKPAVLLKDLQRPVHSAFADLNSDGREDIITGEFGKWTGQLSWWEGAEDGTYAQHILRAQPGATRVYVRDLNDDQYPDLLALFAQGDEGIFAYYNQGDGTFTEQPVLRFPPSYGSSYFNLFDFNGDGHEDIIYTAGDNADYPPVVKPYHGIRIFLNDGKQHFKEAFFYPLPGAYHAIPADFDQDGDVDIAAISFFPDYQRAPEESFVYLENQGNKENPFQFKGYTFPEVNQGRWMVMDAGDMDQDGDVDLILGSLSFEVVPANGMLEQWVKNGVPYVILKNTVK